MFPLKDIETVLTMTEQTITLQPEEDCLTDRHRDPDYKPPSPTATVTHKSLAEIMDENRERSKQMMLDRQNRIKIHNIIGNRQE